MRILLFLASALVWPAFGGECFCLVDADDAVWFDCREQTRARHAEPRLFCTDATTGKQAELNARQGLDRVADGDAPCTPCRNPVDLKTIRNENDKPDATGESTDPAPSGTGPASGKDRP